MKLTNLKSDNGRAVANQFLIEDSARHLKAFQSYDSMVAIYNTETKDLTLGKDWDYSQTTLKYFKQFVNRHTPYCYNDKKSFVKFMEHCDEILIDDNIQLNWWGRLGYWFPSPLT